MRGDIDLLSLSCRVADLGLRTQRTLSLSVSTRICSFAVQHGSHSPSAAIEQLKRDTSELRCAIGVKYIPDFEDLVRKKNAKCLNIFFNWLHIEIITFCLYWVK